MSIEWIALLCAVWCIGQNQGYADAMSHRNDKNYTIVVYDPYLPNLKHYLWFYSDDLENNCDTK